MDNLLRAAQLSLFQKRDVAPRKGNNLYQGSYTCPGCGERVKFYIGTDFGGPRRCADHQGANPVGVANTW